MNRSKNCRRLGASLASLAVSFVSMSAQAGIVGLFDYGFNLDGVVTSKPNVPAAVSLAAFDRLTGLGTVAMTFNTAGAHLGGLFVDHEIDEATNTFFNEFGATNGTAPAGLSWEIDEPGFVSGNIFSHFTATNTAASALDNTNSILSTAPNDVSMAAAFRFTLNPGETGVVKYLLSTTPPPTAGFQLRHTDPLSNTTIYLSPTLSITSVVIPEPATAVWGAGCGLLLAFGRTRCARTAARS